MDTQRFTNRMDAQERYTHDATFHSMVDMFRAMLDQADTAGKSYTPTELREAVMLAATMYEMTHIRPIFMVNVPERRMLG